MPAGRAPTASWAGTTRTVCLAGASGGLIGPLPRPPSPPAGCGLVGARLAFRARLAPGPSRTLSAVVRVRQHLGKYRIDKRLAVGGFATVYKAYDTIEGIPVALKLPHPHTVTKDALEDFRREVRVNAKLDHPNILPIKNAGFIGDKFVIVYPLGDGTLGDRLTKRLSMRTALSFTEQMLEALAFAHAKRVMHLDVKPDNFIIFNKTRLRLADFGIAKVAHKTVQASGAGTVGYIAPEQAMGRPSLRSDVFSMGLILYRMFSGQLPEWPYDWPAPGIDRLKRTLHPQFIAIIRRAMSVDAKDRYADAGAMLSAFRRIKPRAVRTGARTPAAARRTGATRNWKTLRIREFLRRYRTALDIRSTCEQCGEPVAEAMQACPWCGTERDKHRDATSFPARCKRCKRGVKLDWKYCAWCYGPAIGPKSARTYTDKRYVAKCANTACPRRLLMPFMRYGPWCRIKVRRRWPIPPARGETQSAGTPCPRCRHGVLEEFWDYCPWCGKKLGG